MGNNSPYSTLRIRNIAFVSRNDVHVAMKDRLASGFAYINTDIISIGMETLVNLLLDILQHDIHSLTLMVGKVEVIGDMPFGDYQCVTRRHGIAVVESNTGSRLADDFHSAGKTAERTLLAFHARQLVEMVVLV